MVVFDQLGASGSDGGLETPWTEDRDAWWQDAVGTADDAYDTKSLLSDQESMLLYSFGTAGRRGSSTPTRASVQCVEVVYFGFELKPSDGFCWMGDIHWMTGPWSLIGTHTFGGTLFIYEAHPIIPTRVDTSG